MLQKIHLIHHLFKDSWCSIQTKIHYLKTNIWNEHTGCDIFSIFYGKLKIIHQRFSRTWCVALLQAKTFYIDQYSAPKNRQEVLRFAGMAGYYHRFCANFTTVVAPITSLLRKDSKLLWLDECDTSFNLQQMLSSSRE